MSHAPFTRGSHKGNLEVTTIPLVVTVSVDPSTDLREGGSEYPNSDSEGSEDEVEDDDESDGDDSE